MKNFFLMLWAVWVCVLNFNLPSSQGEAAAPAPHPLTAASSHGPQGASPGPRCLSCLIFRPLSPFSPSWIPLEYKLMALTTIVTNSLIAWKWLRANLSRWSVIPPSGCRHLWWLCTPAPVHVAPSPVFAQVPEVGGTSHWALITLLPPVPSTVPEVQPMLERQLRNELKTSIK